MDWFFSYQTQQTWFFGPTEDKLSFFPDRSIKLNDGSEKNMNIALIWPMLLKSAIKYR